MLHSGVRAHGGQGATAGQIVEIERIEAILRGTDRTIRVWQGVAGKREEFTIEEARMLCVEIDQALAGPFSNGHALLTLDRGTLDASQLWVKRQWLIGFAGAVRRALRTYDAATAMARVPSSIDSESDPGSWDRHLRHTADMRGAAA